jgi:Rrf2 family protein
VLSRSSEYAIRALSLLSEQRENGALHSREIAAELDLPPDFLTKILRRLTGTDLVRSQRGRTGGFRLNLPAEQISLLAVVAPFEPQWSGVACLLGQVSCTDREACPVHEPWVEIRKNLYDLLENTTLADVAERASRGITFSNKKIAGEKST